MHTSYPKTAFRTQAECVSPNSSITCAADNTLKNLETSALIVRKEGSAALPRPQLCFGSGRCAAETLANAGFRSTALAGRLETIYPVRANCRELCTEDRVWNTHTTTRQSVQLLVLQ